MLPSNPPATHAIAQIALPTPLPQLFDYLLPPDVLAVPVGVRVRVPFGPQQLVGMVAALGPSNIGGKPRKLRTVRAVLDQAPLFPAELWDTLQFAARYYHHPLGEVIATALPLGLREGAAERPRGMARWRLTGPVGVGAGKTQAQRELLQLLAASDLGETELKAAIPTWRVAAAQLKRRGVIERLLLSPFSPPALRSAAPPLNPEQSEAVRAINAGVGFQAHLLQGITGSGKTEVYLAAISATLARGLDALVLIPEIGLTPQTEQRFRERLSVPLGVMHSQLAEGERSFTWWGAQRGELRVLIGTRSAVFAPLAKLGLIIVDEEHDASYKQIEGFRYHARDMALKRAQTLGIPIVLGSATPALETLRQVELGRCNLLLLSRRAGVAQPPLVELIDLRSARLFEGISHAALLAVGETLRSGGQVLVLRNRRGYAPRLECNSCGAVETCLSCERPYTLHRNARELRCHYCLARVVLPEQCRSCGDSELHAHGIGTERVESALAKHYGEWPLLRIDRDSMAAKGAFAEVLELVRAGKPCVLVGTQMLAKGHDLPEVSLVVVLGADDGLHAQDFRAAERVCQLLVQVAGRAGRANRAGKVLIQTAQPEHPLLAALLGGGYPAVANMLLNERRSAELPPFGHAALLRADALASAALDEFLQAARAALPACEGLEVSGPMPAPMPKRTGRWRAQLLLMAPVRAALHQVLDAWLPILYGLPRRGRVHFSLDVDPQDFA